MGRIKRRILSLMLAVMLCGTVFPASAFSGGESGVLEYWNQTAPSQQPDQPSAEPGPQPDQGEPLSPDSQFSTRDLLYDRDTHKQFITVEGRDGNTFYIVIDYDAPVSGKEEQYKTYFLNQVDEADLSVLVEQGKPAACSCSSKCHAGTVNTACPLCAVNMTECVGKEPEPVQPETPAQTDAPPEPQKKNGSGGTLVVLLAVV